LGIPERPQGNEILKGNEIENVPTYQKGPHHENEKTHRKRASTNRVPAERTAIKGLYLESLSEVIWGAVSGSLIAIAFFGDGMVGGRN